MKRGTLVLPSLPGPPDEHFLRTFGFAGRLPAPFLTLYFRQLGACGFSVPQAICRACSDRYNDYIRAGGRGEMAGQLAE
jgi:hypothetical protein